MGYLYVMDYSDCSITEITIDLEVVDVEKLLNDDDEMDNFLTEHDFNIDECCFMFSYKQINIIKY